MSDNKKPYQKPALKTYGNVEQITQGKGAGTVMDSMPGTGGSKSV